MAVGIREIKPMTGVRGAAAFFVMIYHFHLKQVAAGPFSSVLLHGYLAVDLFFILSGFVMAHTYGRSFLNGTFRFQEFMLHRIARIYPLYLVATLLFIAIGLLRRNGPDFPLPVLISNLFMVQSLGTWPSIDPPAWSVSTEMIAYALFPIIAMLCLKSGRVGATVLGMISVLTILGLSMAAKWHYIGSPISKGQLDLFFSPYTIIRCLAGFTLGQLIYRIRESDAVTRVFSRNLIQFGVLGLGVLSLVQDVSDFLIYLPIIALILMLSADRGVSSRIFSSVPLMLLGKLSFGIYLLHFRALGLLEMVRDRATAAGLSAWESDWVATAVACVVVIGSAWILHVAVERPLRIIIRNAGEKRAASGQLLAERTG